MFRRIATMVTSVTVVALFLPAILAATSASIVAQPAAASQASAVSSILPPLPSAATGGQLGLSSCPTWGNCFNDSDSVSCPSAGNCVAVGDYYGASGELPLVDIETNGSWGAAAPGSAYLPSDAASYQVDFGVVYASGATPLYSVSCPSAGNCVAVGQYENTSGGEGEEVPLIDSETNGSWGAAAPGSKYLPSDADTQVQIAYLTSVSCPSAGNCVAVGSYLNPYNVPLLVTETNGAWGTPARGAAYLPADASGNQNASFYSVSCPSAGNCVAAGTYENASGEQPLLVTETEGAWGAPVSGSAYVPSDAASNPNATLYSVACPSGGNCGAVGNYYNASGSEEPLLVTETIGAWGKPASGSTYLPSNADTNPNLDDPNANDDGLYTLLYAIACPSNGNCVAVGTYINPSSNGFPYGVPLIVSETNGSWTVPAYGFNSLSGATLSVACPSAGNCVAVGGFTNHGSASDILTDKNGTWNAPAWNSKYSPYGPLPSVACPSTGSCVAVGEYESNSGGYAPVIATFSLAALTTPPPSKTPFQAWRFNSTGFTGSATLACSSSGKCTGEYSKVPTNTVSLQFSGRHVSLSVHTNFCNETDHGTGTANVAFPKATRVSGTATTPVKSCGTYKVHSTKFEWSATRVTAS